jgi:hypothetical protein
LVPISDEAVDYSAVDSIDSGGILLVNAPTPPARLNSPPLKPQPTTTVLRSCYRFAHDRIQQAASCLLSREETMQTHIKIAEVCLSYFLHFLSVLSNSNCIMI